MITLAIETSTPHASLCLAKDETILCSERWVAERNHDAYLFPALQRALDELGTAQLDWILVGSGPGSYGGVRVALAAAVGISTITEARSVALCSWESLATDSAYIVSDARRGGWTLRSPDGTIRVISTDELLKLANDEHVRLCTTESQERMLKEGITMHQYHVIPSAEGLVHVWHHLSQEEKERRALSPAEPIYVRPPHITEAKHKPWEIRHERTER